MNKVVSRPALGRLRRSGRELAGLAQRALPVRWLVALWLGGSSRVVRGTQAARHSPRVIAARRVADGWLRDRRAGTIILMAGMLALTLLILALDRVFAPLPNPGTLYLPLVAMLAYHWGWRLGLLGAVLELACVYFFFLAPVARVKTPVWSQTAQLLVLAFGTGFVLALVQLARARRGQAEREAGRFAALNRISTSLAHELDETRLLHLIAGTARELSGAEFAAFTLRPVNALGRPLVPSEGQYFRLAAVVGVTPEQEAQLGRMALGGEGLLAPIFRHGRAVRVGDVFAYGAPAHATGAAGDAKAPGHAAAALAAPHAPSAHAPKEGLRYIGIPRGHPVVRSFLGAPLLDSDGQVRGGLLLGHSRTDQFSEEDEALLVGLAAQASVALENARLYRSAQTQAQELDATFESIADGIALVGAGGEVLHGNRAAQQLLGALDRTQGPATAQSLLRAVAAPVAAGQAPDPTTVSLPGDDDERQEFVVSASALQTTQRPTPMGPDSAPVRADEPAGQVGPSAVVVFHDVTATHRLLAERSARAEAEARLGLLRLVVEELPSGAYLVRGRDARLVLANRAATEVWGATWPAGQPMSAFLASSGTRIFGVDGRQLAADELATVLAVRGGTAIRHHQETIRHPDGTTLPILLNAVALDPGALDALAAEPETAGSGEPVAEPAALVVLQDVTALKEAERLKDDFIGIAAHELRTPMAALKGFAEMLTVQTARGNGPALAEWQREAVDAIDQATARLIELTDDLLDVTRLQAGRLEMRLEPCDLVALALRVRTRLGAAAERHPIELAADPEHVVVVADARRIEQVLGNLLNNAIKYSPAGGAVEVRIGEERGESEDGAAGVAHLSVRDQGIGIPLDQQVRIFGRFARADNARDLGITGTGLGLYLCRELIERHGGRIWFESAPGAGSTFHITLPLLPTEVEGAGEGAK